MHLLILGANSDIAYETAKLFAQHKQASFTLASRDLTALKLKTQDLSLRFNVSAEYTFFDITAYEEHASFYSHLSEKPDIVIIAAGVLDHEAESETDFNKALDIIRTNYTGTLSILNIISNEFAQRKKGTIAVISSVAGLRGRSSNSIYGSTKSAITTYLSGLRQKLNKHNVTVLTILPGFINTKMTTDLTCPSLLIASTQRCAKDIYHAINKKRDVIYTPWFWRWIMLVIRMIPEQIFKKLSL